MQVSCCSILVVGITLYLLENRVIVLTLLAKHTIYAVNCLYYMLFKYLIVCFAYKQFIAAYVPTE